MVRLFRALFGQFSGGSAIVTVLVCAMFTSFTGASGVTIIALGGLLMPVLLQERYSARNALGLVTGAGSLGLLFAPCLPLIIIQVQQTARRSASRRLARDSRPAGRRAVNHLRSVGDYCLAGRLRQMMDLVRGKQRDLKAMVYGQTLRV